MKKKPIGALLVFILMLVLAGLGQTQVIAPPVQVPEEILVGLMGKYMLMIQEYQSLIEQGGTPDSVIEFRLSATVTTDGETDSDLGSVVTGLSRMTYWIKANIFARSPYFVRAALLGSLGDMEILTTETESIFVSRDEAIFAIVPSDGDMTPIMDLPFMELDPLGVLELLQGQDGGLLLQDFLGADMEYDGLELTPKGMAHIVSLTLAGTGEVLTLWVLDETWDLHKVGLDDPQMGTSTIIIIEDIELVADTLPDSTFDIDTTVLAELSYEEFLSVLGLKMFSVALAGVPVAADLSLDLSEVRQGEQVVVSSDGMDSEDAESDLTAQIEYRAPDGAWTPLEASYVGIVPFGHWEAVFVPPTSGIPGSYDFKVTYTDTVGAVSDPLELPAALNVIGVPPQVVGVSPEDRETGVLVSSQIVVTFSQEMDKASVESAFSLTDSAGQVASGAFEWTEATFAFKPDQGLAYSQDYVATILGTAMAPNTVTLDADFVWRFTTKYAPLPEVADISPGDRQLGVLVSAQVSVTFTEVMDQASVEDAFSLTSTEGQVVSGAFQWSDNTLTFIPSQDLEYNGTYQAEVRGSAKSAVGIGLDANGDGVAEGSPKDDYSWWFSTEKYPVLAVKPASQTALGGDFFTVDVVVQSVSQLRSFALTIDFDPTVLSNLKVERASFANWRPRPKIIEEVDIWQSTVIDDEQGLITIAADSTRADGVSGTGTIATLTFQAIGVGESSIQLQDVSFTNALGEDISPELRSGDVQVLEFAPWDINQDGVVNILDFIIIQTDRGANTDVNGDGLTDILDVVAASGGQASPASMPVSDDLGSNYPNPFNPETWIPYQLVRDADVAIRIYSASGRLVRSLELGHKHAGRYVTKAAAAHWDGTNENGERVANGVYYYNIKAGAFSATRKMVILQ